MPRRPAERQGRVRGHRRRRPGRPADRPGARRGGARPRGGRVRADRRGFRRRRSCSRSPPSPRPSSATTSPRSCRRLRAMAARRRDLAALVARRGGGAGARGVALGWRSRSARDARQRPRPRGRGRRRARQGPPAHRAAGAGRAPGRQAARPCRRRGGGWCRRFRPRRLPPPASSRRRRSSSRWPCGAATAIVAGMLAGGQSKSVRIALEAGCLVALAALVWQAASRGQVDARTLAAGGTVDPTLVLAPGAAALACGLLALRVVPPLLRGLARAAERLPVAPYLALVALARQPGRTAAAVAVVAVAGAAATFALGHARTLQEGTLDQAAYRTAADVRGLAPSPGAKPGADDSPVVRIEAEGLGHPLELQLLGVAAPVLPRLPGWREDFSDSPIAQLAKRLDGDPEGVRLQGVAIPRDARELAAARARLRRQRDAPARDPAPRRDVRPPARRPRRTPGRATLVAPVPPAERGGTAVAFEVTVCSGGSGTSGLGEVEPGTLTARRADGTRTRPDRLRGLDSRHRGQLRPRARRPARVRVLDRRVRRLPRRAPAAARRARARPGPGHTRAGAGRSRAGTCSRACPAAARSGCGSSAASTTCRPPRAGETAVADVGRLYAALNTQFPGLGDDLRALARRRRPQARRGPRARLAAVAATAARDPLDPRRDPRPAHPRRPRRASSRSPPPASPSPPRRAIAGRAGRARGDRRPAETLRAQMVAGASPPPAPASPRLARRRRADEPLPRPARARRRRPPPAARAGPRVPLDRRRPPRPCSPPSPPPSPRAIQARRAFRGDTLGRLRA